MTRWIAVLSLALLTTSLGCGRTSLYDPSPGEGPSGTWPTPGIGAAPLDQNPSIKGGPYSQGVYRVREREGEGGFGLLFVNDLGDHIDVAYSGRNNKNEEKISLKFSVPASKPVAQR